MLSRPAPPRLHPERGDPCSEGIVCPRSSSCEPWGCLLSHQRDQGGEVQPAELKETVRALPRHVLDDAVDPLCPWAREERERIDPFIIQRQGPPQPTIEPNHRRYVIRYTQY